MTLRSRDLRSDPIRLAEFDEAAAVIYGCLGPTPQIAWPLLAERCGCEVWVKHENHLPTGAFKVRGGLWFLEHLAASGEAPTGVIAATRGNHGQSIAFAARRHAIDAVIVVPHGNNPEKNHAMRALGAEIIEHGADFNEALDHAVALGRERGLYAMPSFHPLLVNGVGTYAVELLRALPDLDAVYVPVGLGSGIAGMLAARNALGLDTEIIGVVAAGADAYARSFASGVVETTPTADTLADGLAVRIPDADALAYMLSGVSRIVRVSDDAILAAVRHLFEDTHNLAEGAGAAPLAALLEERETMRGKRVGIVLSGGNMDRATFLKALDPNGGAP
jgi:threonine dehydratase